MRLSRLAVGALLVFSLFFLWLRFAFRWISLPLLVAGWLLYFKRDIRPSVVSLLLFLLLSFSPVDVIPIHKSWPPKLVPLVMGYPSQEVLNRARRGEVILGGCIVRGFPPKYLLIW